MLPNLKLHDKEQAKDSIKMLALFKGIDAILPGDGWPVFRDGEQALLELFASS